MKTRLIIELMPELNPSKMENPVIPEKVLRVKIIPIKNERIPKILNTLFFMISLGKRNLSIFGLKISFI